VKRIGGRVIPAGPEEYLDPARTAVLVIDIQNDFLDERGHFAKHGRDVHAMQAMIPRLEALIDLSRAAGARVAFIQQTTMGDGMSDSDAWLYFKTRDGKSPEYTLAGTWGHEFYRIAPNEKDLVIQKFRPSAFAGTELGRLLRNLDVQAVINAGVVTQGCVLATTLDASFHDFYSVVAVDAVQSPNPEQHDNALRFLGSRYDALGTEDLRRIWQ
jgi:ureidoacrylate peracid hydrolase